MLYQLFLPKIFKNGVSINRMWILGTSPRMTAWGLPDGHFWFWLHQICFSGFSFPALVFQLWRLGFCPQTSIFSLQSPGFRLQSPGFSLQASGFSFLASLFRSLFSGIWHLFSGFSFLGFRDANLVFWLRLRRRHRFRLPAY